MNAEPWVQDLTDYRLLTTFEEVVRELGGGAKIGRLTGRSRSAVCNWRIRTGRFPAALFPIMHEALVKKGCQADPRLWTFQQPRRSEAA